MEKNEIIREFCDLSRKVGRHFKYKYGHDCFCEESKPSMLTYTYELPILKFIQEAVAEKIAREK